MTPSSTVVWSAVATGIVLMTGLGFYLLVVYLTRPRSRPPSQSQSSKPEILDEVGRRNAWRMQQKEAYSEFAEWRRQQILHRKDEDDNQARSERAEQTQPGIPSFDE